MCHQPPWSSSTGVGGPPICWPLCTSTLSLMGELGGFGGILEVECELRGYCGLVWSMCYGFGGFMSGLEVAG